MSLDKTKAREIATRLGVLWVEFDPKTGRHTFTRQRYKSIKRIGLDGEVIREGGIISDEWSPSAERVWEEYECYPDQIEADMQVIGEADECREED